MRQDELKELFDSQAAGYDAQWTKTQAIRDCLNLLLDSAFAELPKDARVLCVGVGTGAELAHLASGNPGWSFVAVDPSGAMLNICRQRAESGGFAARCSFHEGYLETLPASGDFDAATCFLVSQFILDHSARVGFFRQIAERLRPGGVLASADIASDIESYGFEVLFRAWMHMVAAAEPSSEDALRMRNAYAEDVGVLPPVRIASIIQAGGFETPVPFFQAGLLHAWISRRAQRDPA